jgi:hypothetical protein
MADELQIELLLAAIGPRAIMKGNPRLTMAQIKGAAAMVPRMRRRIARFMASDTFRPDSSPLDSDDYGDVLALASQPEIDARPLFAAVPDRDLATDLQIAAKRIQSWAGMSIPRDEDDSFSGAPIASPPAISVSDFLAQWRIACDPMMAVADLEDGQLEDDGVGVLAMLWPSFYKEIRQAISDAYASVAARRGKNWQPEPRKARLLRTMQEAEALDMELAAAVQASNAQTQKQSTSPTRGSSQAENNDTQSQELTPGDRAASR